jgi:hypothetical protein
MSNFCTPQAVNLEPLDPRDADYYRVERNGRPTDFFLVVERNFAGAQKIFQDDKGETFLVVQLWWKQGKRILVQRNYVLRAERLKHAYVKGGYNGK